MFFVFGYYLLHLACSEYHFLSEDKAQEPAQSEPAEVFTSRGFRTGAGSPYVLHALSALEDTDQSGGGFVFARWNVSAVLADSAGAELFAWSGTGREGHTSRPEARERALRKTEAVISAGFAEAFDAWAASRL